jgi:uncharacterized membrane protein YfcA
MDILNLIKLAAIVLTVFILTWFLLSKKDHNEHLPISARIQTGVIGFMANFFDTFGIGSFATIVALRRMFGLMPDDVRLIGSMNLQAVLPTILQSLIFLHFIDVDLVTLAVACSMITLGGFLSGFIAINISKGRVRKIMLVAFCLTGVILLLSQLGLLPITGSENGLTGYKLALFSLLMLFAGFLPAFGVGYYSLVQISIVLFGVNPLIAFPIMTTASAFQMPVTTVPFLIKKKFYKQSSLILMLTGAIGVALAAPLIAHVNSYYLKWILVIIIGYNILILSKRI